MSNDAAVLDKNPITPVAVGQAQPQNPVSLGGKERSVPLVATSETVSNLQAEGPERSHEISQDLKDLGVKEIQNKPVFTQEHIDAGIRDSNPAPSVSTNTVTLPMTEQEIESQLKTGQDDDSKKWLAWLFNKVIKWGFKNQ